MDYLGVTGVEDKLQNNVESTIEALKSAGIQIWMLTGDKVETATSISISSGLKSKKNHLFFMRELTNPVEIYDKVAAFEPHAPHTTLIIDGKSLSTIMNDDGLKRRWFEQAMRAPCVCICRCSPTQKADVTKLMRTLTEGKRIAAIGDGGNDVGMILEADCGIGIEGKEGMQASLAADFSLKEFG
jgi:phospholipid-translocating ATPase